MSETLYRIKPLEWVPHWRTGWEEATPIKGTKYNVVSKGGVVTLYIPEHEGRVCESLQHARWIAFTHWHATLSSALEPVSTTIPISQSTQDAIREISTDWYEPTEANNVRD